MVTIRGIFILIFLSIGTLTSVFAQYSIQPGTKSNRVNDSGDPTNTYYKMTSFDSSPFEEYSLEDNNAYVRNMNFRLLKPKGYNPNDATKKYPMAVFLHGAGESGIEWPGRRTYAETDPRFLNNDHSLSHGGKQHIDAVNRNQNDPLAFPGFVLVAQNEAGWYSSQVDKVIKIVELLIQSHQIDPNRIYAEGLSNGGAGTWSIVEKRPDLFAAFAVFSAVRNTDYSQVVHLPLWLFQGGQDTNPYPSESHGAIQKLESLGATPRFTEYANLGHGVWNRAWEEPDFFSFFLRHSKLSIHVFYGDTAFCAGDPINVRLGISKGFDGYQWRKNGTVINDSVRNEIWVNTLGAYQVRFRRGLNWTEWSKPVNIGLEEPTPTPVISTSSSKALPSLDGNTNVTLAGPAGNASYRWYSNGTTLVGSAQNFVATQAGNFSLSVTKPQGCPSLKSSAVYVTTDNTTGDGTPDPLVGSPNAPLTLKASTISSSEIKLSWQDNSSDEKGFELYRASKAGGPYTLIKIAETDITNFIDKGLNHNSIYYYRLRAVNDLGGSLYTPEIKGSTIADKEAPTAPQELIVTFTTDNSIGLQWSPSTDNAGIDKYLIFYSNMVGNPIATTSTSHAVTGLNSSQIYSFTVKAVDKAGNISEASNQVTNITILSGLKYKYYVGGTWDIVADYDNWPVEKTGNIANFNINTTDGNPAGVRNPVDQDYFAFDFEGKIFISTAGTYTFYTSSDDGSKLYINDQLIVDNDGLHGLQEKSGAINLSTGGHAIKVRYFDRSAGDGLQVRYAGPGVTKKLIPDDVLKSSSLVLPAPPSPPFNIAATASVTSTKILVTLTWSDTTSSETGFEIYRSASLNTSYSKIFTSGPNITSFIDSNVVANTTYYYKLRAISNSGESKFSDEGILYSFYPTAQSNLNTPLFSGQTPSKSGFINNFLLDPRTTDNNYGFKYSGFIDIKQAGTYTFYTTSDDGSRLFIGETAVVNNDFNQAMTERSGSINLSVGKHPITVAYRQGSGGFGLEVRYQGPNVNKQLIPNSVLSSANVSVTTPAGPQIPVAPSNLVASTSTRYIQLNWSDNSDNETGFEIYRSTESNGDFIKVFTTGPGIKSHTDKNNLIALTTYYYKVRAINGGGASEYSNEVFATTPDVPVSPSNLELKLISSKVVELQWTDKSINESGFKVERTTVAENNFTELPGTVSSQSGTGTVIKFRDTNLSPGTKYLYRVKAINDDGSSEPTNEMAIETPSLMMFVNFGGGSGTPPTYSSTFPYYWNIGTNTVNPNFLNLVNDANVSTGISLKTNISFSSYRTTSGTSANSTGVYPDYIMLSNLSLGSLIPQIQLTGLPTDKIYNFVFFGSSGNSSKSVAVYTIPNSETVSGGGTAELNCYLNTTQTTRINGVMSSDGEVLINFNSLVANNNGHFNALVIEAFDLPPVTYYANGSGDLNSLETWSTNEDGTGTKPSTFSKANQTFVVKNSNATLSNNWNVSGSNSKVIIEENGNLTIPSAYSLNGKVDVLNGGTLTVESNTLPTIGLLSETSTVQLSSLGAITIPSRTYGILKLGGGVKSFASGATTIKGDLFVDVSIQGANNNSTELIIEKNIIVGEAGTIPSSLSNLIALKVSGASSQNIINGNLVHFKNITINSGSRLALSIPESNPVKTDLSITGDFTNHGIFDAGSSKISFEGTSAQSIVGENYFYDLTINNASGVTISNGLSNYMSFVKSTVKLQTNAKLTTNNRLTLLSDENGTGRIAKVEPGASLIGEVTIQRYVGPSKVAGWYYFGTSMKNQKIKDWSDDFRVQGVAGGNGGSPNTFFRDEPTFNWKAITDINQTINPGVGFKAYIYASQFTDGTLMVDHTGIPVIGDGTGNVTGAFSFNLTKTGEYGGWNLISNPYPSEIDWNASGWDKSNIDNSFYVWDGTFGSYKAYIGEGGSNRAGVATLGGASKIGSGQGFMVYATTPGNSTLTVTENVKSEGFPTFYREEAEEPIKQLSVTIKGAKRLKDETIIRFANGANKGFDKKMDALKLKGPYLNILTVPLPETELAINTLPALKESEMVNLKVEVHENGNYKLLFNDLSALGEHTKLYLKDLHLNTVTEVASSEEYPFEVTNNKSSQGERFILVFAREGEEVNVGTKFSLIQNYPNPFATYTLISFISPESSLVKVTIFNSLGEVIERFEKECKVGMNSFEWSNQSRGQKKLNPGIYFYNVSIGSISETRKMILEK